MKKSGSIGDYFCDGTSGPRTALFFFELIPYPASLEGCQLYAMFTKIFSNI